MKIVFALWATLFISATSAQELDQSTESGVFTQRAYCEINAGQSAICEVCNYESYRPIRCEMSIRGQTLYGFWFQGHQVGSITYGQCMYGYVYANNPMRDPLVSVDAYATCRGRF